MIQIPSNWKEIPFDGIDANARMTTPLAGIVYRLRFDWKQRSQRWFFTLETSDGTPILTNKKIVSQYFIRRKHDDWPEGCFACLEPTNEGGNPGRNNFGYGKKFRFYFVPNE